MSIERYSRARQIDLGRSLAARHKIYLDTRFWIIVRDVAHGVRNEPKARKLLHHLRRGVRSGRLLCLISASIFMELMKQPYTRGRRIGTAQLIDELSLGVSMIPPQVVMGTEVHTFLLQARGDDDLHPMQELIWTKVGYVLGDVYPALKQLSSSEELAIQKAFFDHLWDHSLSEILEVMGEASLQSRDFVNISRETNENNAQYKDELRSFPRTYDIELRGAIEVAGEVAADTIEELTEKEAEHSLSSTPQDRAETVNMCRNLLYHAFKKPKVRSTLRSLHIGASIHASMRWNKDRKFKPNDYYDFEHATAALSYCDAFLTEKSLHDLVTRPQVNLEAINGCQVFSDVAAAADYVRELLAVE